MTDIKPNYYEILNVTPQATLEELKTSYKQLILQCHPDKLQQQQKQEQEENLENSIKNLEIKDGGDHDDPNSLKFVWLTEAWNCLKDPIKRKQYDAELLLNKFHTHNNIYAHIKLSEMKKVTNVEDYYFHDHDHDDDYNDDVEEERIKETPKYLYIYNCRCGGQYVVDESAEQYCRTNDNYHHHNNDDETQIKNSDSSSDKHNNYIVGDNDDADPNTQNKNSPNTNEKNKEIHDDGGGDSGTASNGGIRSEGVVFKQDNNDDDETTPTTILPPPPSTPPPPAAEAGKTTATEIDDDNDGELIVECSECSLVIILNG